MLAVGFPRDAKPLENLLLERYEKIISTIKIKYNKVIIK